MEEEQKTEVVQTQPSNIPTDVASEVSSRRSTGSKKKKNIKRIIVILLFLAVFAAGGWFLLKEPIFDEDVSEESSLTELDTKEEPTSTPIPTEIPVDKENVSIQILNGTGIAGEATYLQGKLRSLDYTEIEVGNAESQDNETTTVTFSSTLQEEIVDEITEELEKVYNKVTVKTSSSLEDDEIEIIVGLRKGQSLPTAAPTNEPTPTTDPSVTQTPTPTPSPTVSPSPTPTP